MNFRPLFRSSLGILIVAAYCSGISRSSCQTVDLEFYNKLVSYPTASNTNGGSLTMRTRLAGVEAECDVSVPYSTNDTTCGYTSESDVSAASIEIGRTYTLIIDITPRDASACGTFSPWPECEPLNTMALFVTSNFNCQTLLIENYDCSHFAIGTNVNWAHIHNTGDHYVVKTLTFTVDTGKVDFYPCGPLVADGSSQKQAFLWESTLPGPVKWEIVGDALGCGIDEDTGIITAGTEEGGITVIAVGTNGCKSLPGSLDLEKPEEDGDEGDDTDCSTCDDDDLSKIGSGAAQTGSIYVRMRMGKSALGGSARSLLFHAQAPTNNLFTPAYLRYPWRKRDVAVVRSNGVIRQVKAAQGLADVVTVSTNRFEVRYYAPTNVGIKIGGLYPTNGLPFATWTFENPQAGTSNSLRVTDSPASGNSVTYEYLWITNGWELSAASGLRIETQTESWSTNGSLVYRTENQQVRPNVGAIVSASSKTFLVNTNWEAPVEEVFGSGPTARTNTYSYYSGTRLLQQLTRWDGSWEIYHYDTNRRPSEIFSAYQTQGPTTNKALCRVRELSYATNVVSGSGDNGTIHVSAPRRIIEKIQNYEVARSYHVILPFERREIACFTPGAAWDNPSNLVTTTKFMSSGASYGQVFSVRRPDQTMDIYYYPRTDYTGSHFSSLQNETNIVLSGKPDTYGTNITEGTKVTTVIGPLGEMITRTVLDIASGVATANETFSDYDTYLRPQKVTHLDGTWDYTVYDCCGSQTTTNREGTVTTRTFDALKRVISTTTGGITLTNQWDAAGRRVGVVRKGSDGSWYSIGSATYDTAGRRISSTDALGNTTTFSESVAPIVRTTTYPNLGTKIQHVARDGRIVAILGSAVYGSITTNVVEGDGVMYDWDFTLTSFGGGPDWVKQYKDMLGRHYESFHPDAVSSYSFYNTNGQLARRVDSDDVTTLLQYNGKGELEYTAIDTNRNGVIDFSGGDRITQTRTTYIYGIGGHLVRRAATCEWPTFGSASSNLVSFSDSTIDGRTNWTMRLGLTNRTERYLKGNGKVTVTNVAPDGTYAVSEYQDERLLWTGRFDLNHGVLTTNGFGYDAHGRRTSVVDARTGTTTYDFDNADRVTSITTPSPGSGQSAQTTTTHYNKMGWVTNVIHSDGGAVRSEYHLTGRLATNWGARTYPAAYTYDYAGRQKTMITWQDFATRQGAATTTWNYEENRGALESKVYADGKGTDYVYSPGGRLATRTWERGVTTSYGYNNLGELVSVNYSDSTPDVTYELDRRGRQTGVTQGTNTTLLILDEAGRVLSEVYTGGTLQGLGVTNVYDTLGRRTENGIVTNGIFLEKTTAAYDTTTGRLNSIGDGSNVCWYIYLGNSDLISAQHLSRDGLANRRLSTIKTYDNLNRMISVAHSNATLGVFGYYNYAYNSANQRTSITNADGRWAYAYDSLGQVTSGKRHWNDNQLVAGQQFEYAYDDIGNRKSAASGGNEWGSGLRYENYTVNNVNQYTQRTVPGSVDVIGAATNAATVTVNNHSTSRRGEYFRANVPVTNTAAPVYVSLTNLAVLPSGTNADIATNITGNLYIAKTPEVFLHDPDGNLVQDGQWTNRWDAENRWIEAETISTVPTAAKKKLVFGYDHKWRRTRKTVYDWNTNTSAWVVAKDHEFVYDAWNLLAELGATNHALINSYLWGLDMSGTPQGAGGVGGLTTIKSSEVGAHFYGIDGNGNVVALVNATNATVSGRYQYEPFGNRLRVSGTAGILNPFGFSTKYGDEGGGKWYFGYRFLGNLTWVSRDPFAEPSFPVSYYSRSAGKERNDYAFVENDPISAVDYLGLFCCAGKLYNPFTHCCVRKNLYERKEQDTGVSICSAPTETQPKVDHEWLEGVGEPAGFYPNGSTDGTLPGQVVQPDPATNRKGKKCEPIKLNPCKYDVEKFLKCLQKYIKDTKGDPAIYHVLGLKGINCYGWVSEGVNPCKNGASLGLEPIPMGGP